MLEIRCGAVDRFAEAAAEGIVDEASTGAAANRGELVLRTPGVGVAAVGGQVAVRVVAKTHTVPARQLVRHVVDGAGGGHGASPRGSAGP